jgi:hypothetical protein
MKPTPHLHFEFAQIWVVGQSASEEQPDWQVPLSLQISPGKQLLFV